MDTFDLANVEEKIESIFMGITYNKPEENLVTPSLSLLEDMKNQLNNLFQESGIVCTNVIYTNNTDKPFFGVMVNPGISAADSMVIIATDEEVKLKTYQVELDSKLFNLGLDAAELTATLIFEISSMMCDNSAIENTRAIIDLNSLKDDDVIYLRDSANYAQLVIYALKDTLYKVSSVMFKTDIDQITCNQYIQVLDLQEEIISAEQKISTSVFGTEDTLRDPKASVMNWMLLMYKDMKHNSRLVKDTLRDAKSFTGSRLTKSEIDKTIDAVDNINGQIVIENCDLNSHFDKARMGAVNEISLFQALKRSGLRSIEDDLYEFAIRMKNCETEDDAMYILRGINTRLNILEDYLIQNADSINDNEKKHWQSVANQYRNLRAELAKKKIGNKKQYGIWFDYDKLDQLD
jgi:hypothetical protein